MTKKQAMQLFRGEKVRTAWDDETEKWYFSIVDVCAVLTDSDYQTARKYWKVLKGRLVKEGNETVTNCYQLKMKAYDGKMRMTDVADTEQLLRIIQSIPSPKAEPFKTWMASVATRRIDQMLDPELSIEQAREDYRRKGYSDKWINQRLNGIKARNELTDEWKERGVREEDYGLLTDDITRTWSGKTTSQYKRFKRLDPRRRESLRDNMTTIELALNTLAEASTTEISRKEKPSTLKQNRQVARKGGKVAKIARDSLEKQLGRSVVTSQKAGDYLSGPEKRKEIEDRNEE